MWYHLAGLDIYSFIPYNMIQPSNLPWITCAIYRGFPHVSSNNQQQPVVFWLPGQSAGLAFRRQKSDVSDPISCPSSKAPWKHIEKWVFPKIGVPPHHPFKRVFHYFHHPFWGTTIFGNTQMVLGSSGFFPCKLYAAFRMRRKNTVIQDEGACNIYQVAPFLRNFNYFQTIS